MTYLYLGVIIFTGMHLFPAAAGVRQTLISRIGEKSYMGIFSLIVLGSTILMGVGYSQARFINLYNPPVWGRSMTAALMLLSLILFAAANMPGNIKRLTRHPMLWGLVLWSMGHLCANGDKASVVLFGGLGLFGLIAMLSANLRGAVKQQDKVPLTKDLMVIVAGIIAYGVFVFAHPYLFGVSVI